MTLPTHLMNERQKAQSKAQNKRYYVKHNERLRAKVKKQNIAIRKEIIEALGGVCVHCGFSDIRALQIDHVFGNGYRERMTLRGSLVGYHRHVLNEIKNGSTKYQLLCANCNWIKRYEKAEYRCQ